MNVMFPWSFSPFDKNTMKKMQQMRPEEVEKYVNDLMGKMLPPDMQTMNNSRGTNPFNIQSPNDDHNHSPLHASVFETHDHVFVMIPITNEEWLQTMRLCHTSNQLIVEHIPEREDKQTITLPAIVRKKGTKASYKDGRLEIKFLKNVDMQYSEIDITEKY
jgi:hypothetical protein